MSNKLMTPTEKEIEFFTVHSKECNGCKRHGKDMMISYSYKGEKELCKVLTPSSEVFEKFKHLGIDKDVLKEIISVSQTYQNKEVDYSPNDIIDLFMTNKQAEELSKSIQKTLEKQLIK